MKQIREAHFHCFLTICRKGKDYVDQPAMSGDPELSLRLMSLFLDLCLAQVKTRPRTSTLKEWKQARDSACRRTQRSK